MTRILVSLFCMAAVLGERQDTQNARHEIQGYLTKSGFTAEAVAKLEAGETISRAQITGNEIVVIGAVKVRAPRDRVMDYYGQVIAYVDGNVTLAFGRLGVPPAPGDVKDLAFSPSEVADLRSCKPSRCDIKLGGAALSQLQSSIDWSAADAVGRVNSFVQKAAVGYVAAYQSRGDAALITYDDRSKPLNLQEQWRGIIKNSAYFHEYAPELKAYLEQYPKGSLPGARDVFYWANEDYGFKPILSIVHGVVYQPPAKSDRAYVVQKQIYASHYFEGSLAVATLLSSTENGAPSTYLVYVNRSRGDMLKGGFGGLKRNMAQSQAQKGAQQTLETIKKQLEQPNEI